MCMRQNREPSFEAGDADIDDPIRQMREPPGALGDIVRRMKRRAALKTGMTLNAAAVRDGGHTIA